LETQHVFATRDDGGRREDRAASLELKAVCPIEDEVELRVAERQRVDVRGAGRHYPNPERRQPLSGQNEIRGTCSVTAT
jgi:hypothetical protein